MMCSLDLKMITHKSERLYQRFQEIFGILRVVSIFGEFFNQGLLCGNALFALPNVAFCQGKMVVRACHRRTITFRKDLKKDLLRL